MSVYYHYRFVLWHPDVKGPGAVLARPKLGRVRWQVPFWQDSCWAEHSGPLQTITSWTEIQTQSPYQEHNRAYHSMNDQQEPTKLSDATSTIDQLRLLAIVKESASNTAVTPQRRVPLCHKQHGRPVWKSVGHGPKRDNILQSHLKDRYPEPRWFALCTIRCTFGVLMHRFLVSPSG